MQEEWPKKIHEWEQRTTFTQDWKFERTVTFTAWSFEHYVREWVPGYNDLPDVKNPIEIGERLRVANRLLPMWYKGNPYRSLRVPMFCLPKAEAWLRGDLKTWKGKTEGVAMFDGDVRIPILFTATETVMSLTPMEVMTMRPGLRKARGNVLIGGYGLGVFARWVAKKPGIKSVTVIEKEGGLFDQFRPEDGVRTLRGCAYEYAEKRMGEFDSVLFDIWDDYGGATWDDRWAKIKRNHPNAWGWGDVTSRPEGSIYG